MLVLIVLLFNVGVTVIGEVTKKPYYNTNDRELCFKHFENFINTYDKEYRTEEEVLYRFKVFSQNLQKINEHNSNSPTSIHDVTRFSDLTDEEFVNTYTGLVVSPDYVPHNPADLSNISLSDVPESFDWRDKKVVSEVKNQGHCGSCWAFSIIGNLESQYAMKYNKIIEFSEQQLVSCCKNYLAKGCQGGNAYTALLDLQKMGGMESEEDYPYTSGTTRENGTCYFDKDKVKAKVKSFQAMNLMKMSEDKLKDLLYKNGPISIALAGKTLKQYKGGINQNCDDDEVNHQVLLVGYGEENSVPYWTFKNSWGKDVGERGYFRLLRGKNCLFFMNFLAASGTIE